MMENVFNLTPLQSLLVLALNAWILIIFPILVLKKLNYMTGLLEAQFEQQEEDGGPQG